MFGHLDFEALHVFVAFLVLLIEPFLGNSLFKIHIKQPVLLRFHIVGFQAYPFYLRFVECKLGFGAFPQFGYQVRLDILGNAFKLSQYLVDGLQEVLFRYVDPFAYVFAIRAGIVYELLAARLGLYLRTDGAAAIRAFEQPLEDEIPGTSLVNHAMPAAQDCLTFVE